MRAAFGAVGGALAVGAMLVSYNIGARNAFSGQMTAPTTQMLVGPGRHRAAVSGAGRSRRLRPGRCRGSRTDGRRTPRRLRALSLRWHTRPIRRIRRRIRCRRNTSTERAVAQAPVRRVSTQRVVSEVEAAAVVAEERAVDRRLGWHGRRARRAHRRQEGRARGRGHRRRRGGHLRSGETTLR